MESLARDCHLYLDVFHDYRFNYCFDLGETRKAVETAYMGSSDHTMFDVHHVCIIIMKCRYLWLIPAIAFFGIAGICFTHLDMFTFFVGALSTIGGICCLQVIKHKTKTL